MIGKYSQFNINKMFAITNFLNIFKKKDDKIAISKLTGTSEFKEKPPAWHFMFLFFIITFAFLPITWLIPLPGVCLINMIVSGTFFIIFLILYFVYIGDDTEKFFYNMSSTISSKFGINLEKIFKNAQNMRKSSRVDRMGNDMIDILKGDKQIFKLDTAGFDDYATLVTKDTYDGENVTNENISF